MGIYKTRRYNAPPNYDKLTPERAYEKGVKRGREDATEIIFYMLAWTIQYKMDFGKKRLQRIMKETMNNIEAFGTGHLSPEDYVEIKNEIENKYDIRLKVD